MPYKQSARLPGERASKIGHLDVIKSPLVQKLCSNFEDPDSIPETTCPLWSPLPDLDESEIKLIFSVDGSLQILTQPQPPYKTISFVKTALLRVDQYAIAKLDKEAPHPLALKDIIKDSALYHATVFPLKNVFIAGNSVLHSVRGIIFESIKDEGENKSLDGQMMETLKWLAYEKWNPEQKKQLEPFGCPHCNDNVATLPYDQEIGACPKCGGQLFLTDLFGLHLNMQDDFAPNQVASDYMTISETLMIFTPIRYFWETKKEVLDTSLLIKDGPLSLRATLSKLAAPIRRFFKFAKEQGVDIAMVGQEKTGTFVDHLQMINKTAPCHSYFIPDNNYIRNEIQHSNSKEDYGKDTNYGAKIFVKFDDFHQMVLSIPTGEKGECVKSPSVKKLIAFNKIIAALPALLSSRHESALVPIELAHGIASLSTYPSAKVLKLFSDSLKK